MWKIYKILHVTRLEYTPCHNGTEIRKLGVFCGGGGSTSGAGVGGGYIHR